MVFHNNYKYVIINMMTKFEEDDEELVVLGPLGDPWRPMSL